MGKRWRGKTWWPTARCAIWNLTFLLSEAAGLRQDRKSTRLNSSHSQISYAVFCLKNNSSRRTTTGARRAVGRAGWELVHVATTCSATLAAPALIGSAALGPQTTVLYLPPARGVPL